MNMPALLITGIYYAPEETGIALNTTGLAEGLAERGWDVTVVTGIPHFPSWRPQPAPPVAGDERVRLIRRNHFVPSRQTIALRAAYEASWLTSCLPQLLERRPADVILGVTPTLAGGVLAALGARRWRVPYVVMFQDLLGRGVSQSRFPHANALAPSLEKIELTLAARAAGVAVVADGFKDYLTQRGIAPGRVHRVRNPVRLPRGRGDREATRRAMGWSGDEFVVLHSGNMGFKQGLENVLRAAGRAAPGERIRFVLQGDGNQRASLQGIARELEVRNVSFAALVDAAMLPDVLAAADVLLLNQRREVRDMSLPAKLTSYFAVGRPVVAAVAPESDSAREVIASRGGIVVEPDQPEALLGAVRSLAARRAWGDQLGAAGRAYAEAELRPEATVDHMESLLERCLAETAQPDRRENEANRRPAKEPEP